jgi:hypothetical protein
MKRSATCLLVASGILLLGTQFSVAQERKPELRAATQRQVLEASTNGVIADTYLGSCSGEPCDLTIPPFTWTQDDGGISFTCEYKTCTMVVDMWAVTCLLQSSPSERALGLYVDGGIVGNSGYVLGEDASEGSCSGISAISTHGVAKGSHTATVQIYSANGDIMATSQNVYSIYHP